jgi:5,10-methylenetetrahydrofolate reductase
MLSERGDWVEMVEVNPPRLPSMTHRALEGRWPQVLITDNPFKQVRVSPYAFAARITHDLTDVRPTVVCSTRDRNILAIESEVRGAIGNGVDSFLVVQGDMLPEVEHWSNSYEIVEHLRALQEAATSFEVGMSTRSRSWVFRRRIEVGAQFLTTGPVMDPATVQACADRLGMREGDPPVYLEVTPPFSSAWVHRLERVGALPVGDELRARLAATPEADQRRFGWRAAKAIARGARGAGFAGVVLMGLRFETAVGEAYDVWQDERIEPLDPVEARSEPSGERRSGDRPASLAAEVSGREK